MLQKAINTQPQIIQQSNTGLSILAKVGISVGIGVGLYFAFGKKLGLKGVNICHNRVKCKGINKSTGKAKDGYYYGKNGKVVRKHEGINNKGQLKKGYKYAKGGRVIKAKKGSK